MSERPSPTASATQTPTVGSRTLDEGVPPSEEQPAGKGARFWLVFASLMMATFVGALDIVSQRRLDAIVGISVTIS